MPNPEDVKPVLFGQSHVTKALADPRFFELLPEFRSMQVKLQTMKVNLQDSRGCSGCKQRRATSNLFNDFLSIMSALSPDGIVRLKQYIGAPSIMLNTIDRTNGQAALKII